MVILGSHSSVIFWVQTWGFLIFESLDFAREGKKEKKKRKSYHSVNEGGKYY